MNYIKLAVVDNLDKLIVNKTAISDEQVAEIYKTNPGVWVILEVLNMDENKRAKKLKVLKYNKNKEILRDYLLEHDELTEVATLIYFFTGFDGTCQI